MVVWQSDFFLSIFTTESVVLAFADTRVRTVLAFQFIASYYEVAGSAMRGLGYSMTPTLIIIFGARQECLWRISFSYEPVSCRNGEGVDLF